MPRSRPVCSWVGIWCVWSVWMSFAMALVITMTSQIALRPRPSAVLTSTCVTTASRLCARKLLVCSRSSTGSASMMRSMVFTAGGVQRAEHEVPGFRGRHRHGNRLGIAQLADEDHVRVFAHRGAHAFGEARDVRVQLALDHLAFLLRWTNSIGSSRLMMFSSTRRVQVVDHRGERGRLAGAGGAGDQDHALVVVAQLRDDRRQRQLLERRHVGRNRAERGADAGVLAEHVDAEAPALGRHVGEVEVVALAEVLGLVPGQDLGDVALELGVARRRGT